MTNNESLEGYEAYEWKGGIPEKVDGVCCDTLEFDTIVVPELCLYTCSGCGKHYKQPKSVFRRISGNPKYDKSVRKV